MTYKTRNHGPVIGTKCAGVYPQPESREDDETRDNTKHDARNSDRVHLVGVINRRRRR